MCAVACNSKGGSQGAGVDDAGLQPAAWYARITQGDALGWYESRLWRGIAICAAYPERCPWLI